MGRKKVELERIADNKKRNIIFRNRKQGIFKKARELATLCDVNISMIICTDDHQEPEIFPQDPHKFSALIDRYRRNRIMEPGNIRYYGLSGFFKERKIKIEEELAKAKKKNLQGKYPTWFDSMNNFSEGQLRIFASGLGCKIKQVKAKIESLKKVSKVQNDLDRYPNAVLDVQSSFVTPPLNPSPITTINPTDYNKLGFDPAPLSGDHQNNSFMKSSNSNFSSLESLEKWLMSDDDDVMYYDHENFNLEPPLSSPCTDPCCSSSGFGLGSSTQTCQNPNPITTIIPPDYNNLGLDPAPLSGDQNNSVVKSSNSNLSFLDSLEKWLMSDDDDKITSTTNENFNLEPHVIVSTTHRSMLQQQRAGVNSNNSCIRTR